VRHARNSPKQAAADRQQQSDDEDLAPADSLGAALAVVPREHHSQHKAHGRSDNQDAADRLGPAESLADQIQQLDQCECGCRIGQRPLHDLALPESLKNFFHARPRLRSAECIAALRARRHADMKSAPTQRIAAARCGAICSGCSHTLVQAVVCTIFERRVLDTDRLQEPRR